MNPVRGLTCPDSLSDEDWWACLDNPGPPANVPELRDAARQILAGEGWYTMWTDWCTWCPEDYPEGAPCETPSPHEPDGRGGAPWNLLYADYHVKFTRIDRWPFPWNPYTDWVQNRCDNSARAPYFWCQGAEIP